MKVITSIPVFLGLLLFGALLWNSDVSAVIEAALVPGWAVGLLILLRFLPLTSDALGWRSLFDAGRRPPASRMLLLRWIGEAVNTSLPVAQLGGHATRIAMAARIGVSRSKAAATVLVDFAFGIATQIAYTLLAVTLLFERKEMPLGGWPLFSGVFVIILIFLAVPYLPRLRLSALASRWVCILSGRRFISLLDGARHLDRQFHNIVRPRRKLIQSLFWRLVTRGLYTAETWLALQLLGTNASWVDALIIDGLVTGVRSAAFAVPGALGVQEAGFLLVGQMVGLSAEASLALALLRRLREIAIGTTGVATLLLLEKNRITEWLSARPAREERALVIRAIPRQPIAPAASTRPVTLSGTPPPPG